MKTLKLVLTFILGAFILFGGVNHFLKPDMYLPFIPAIFPQKAIIYLSGIVEIALGIGVFIPKFRYKAGFGILLLMLVFLPLHIWDVFSATPAIGSHKAALIRLPLQFVLIAWAWFISKKSQK